MNAIRLIVLVPSLFLLLGGATPQAKLPETVGEALASWKGTHVDKLIAVGSADTADYTKERKYGDGMGNNGKVLHSEM